jgi:hypothetical protein
VGKAGKKQKNSTESVSSIFRPCHIFSWHPSAQEDLVSACFGMFRHSILSKEEAEKLEL